MADRPLWAAGRPPWSDSAWFMLLSALPNHQGWEIWFDWYEQRQRGGSRGKEYELVFASVPKEEWDKGPAAANAWIKAHLSPRGNERPPSWPEINDSASLALWLADQSPEVGIAIASRTALRVAPLVAHALQGLSSPQLELRVGRLASAAFRAGALAQVVAKYPHRASDFGKAAREAVSYVVPVAQNAAHAAAAFGAIKAAIAGATATFAEAGADTARTAEAALTRPSACPALHLFGRRFCRRLDRAKPKSGQCCRFATLVARQASMGKHCLGRTSGSPP